MSPGKVAKEVGASFFCLKMATQVNCEVFTLLGRYAAYVASCLPAATNITLRNDLEE
jgi:hypothetical protein